MQEYLENYASLSSKKRVKNDTNICEMFVTDKFGGLVASSGKTSDFYQADEDWWQKGFADAEGKVFIGNIILDRSTDTLSIPIAVPVKDKNGDVIGICKEVVDLSAFFEPLENFKLGKTGHPVLIDEKGMIIFHHLEFHFSTVHFALSTRNHIGLSAYGL